MKRNTRSGFTLVELMVVIGILGLLVGILAVAVIPRLTGAKKDLEIKQMGDLKAGFDQMLADDGAKKRLRDNKKISEAKGHKLYEALFKNRLLGDELVTKIVSLNSQDVKADKAWIEQSDGTLPVDACSYTLPKGSDLFNVMKAKGNDRCIFISFNSRNWNNYDDAGVLVLWSDGEKAEYMRKEDATSEPLSLDGETWTSNPKEIIGQKKPFHRTFE